MSMPPVASGEWLARFVFFRNRIRHDGTLKADEFVPFPHTGLSVTRHLRLTEADLWNIGQDIARQRGKPVLARADLQASSFERHRLRVIPAPVDRNANHAEVVGWPPEKSSQKIIAIEIAADAGRVRMMPMESQ
ncbi:MAG: hypothetical protein AB1714_03420 [Acidobacteriota bacterium]